MESIKSIEKGNNPHVGYGFYDMGQDYLDHLRHIFKSEIEADKFSSVEEYGDENTMNQIRSFGFGSCREMKVDSKTLTFIDHTLTPYGEVDRVEW